MADLLWLSGKSVGNSENVLLVKIHSMNPYSKMATGFATMYTKEALAQDLSFFVGCCNNWFV